MYNWTRFHFWDNFSIEELFFVHISFRFVQYLWISLFLLEKTSHKPVLLTTAWRVQFVDISNQNEGFGGATAQTAGSVGRCEAP